MEVINSNFAIFINSHRLIEYIDGADQDEPVAHNGLEMADQGFYSLPVMLGRFVGFPLLGRGASTYQGVEFLFSYFMNVSGSI